LVQLSLNPRPFARREFAARTARASLGQPDSRLLSFEPERLLPRQLAAANTLSDALRLIVSIDYARQVIYVKHVLTHKEYDKENWKKDCGG
jgi:mRNA-degrading endonuclease HigB of HigAB toxin-antitoxin module